MEFTNQEIIFLTSVSHGRKPLGVKLCMPKREEREDYIHQTIRSLTEKEILNKEGELTREGADILYIWEQYRNSERHISVNGTYMAEIPGGKLLAVIPTKKGYDVRFIMPETIMLNLLKENTYLCRKEEKALRGKWEDMDLEKWYEETAQMDGGLVFREYMRGKETTENIYCWKNEKGYLLNMTRRRVRELSTAVMRRQIYTMLGGNRNGI